MHLACEEGKCKKGSGALFFVEVLGKDSRDFT
jgi:hypothetical protein